MDLLIIGLGVTGEALARHAHDRGWSFTIAEDLADRPGHDERVAAVEAMGGTVVVAPDEDLLRELARGADLVVPSPGVPAHHPVYAVAADAGVSVVSEIEMASRGAEVPIVAVTGTNGKTTVTSLIARMLRSSGVTAAAAGNIGRPLVEAVDDDVDVVVAEVSSFQLEYTDAFRPKIAVLLNVADDHLDWHPDVEHYRNAKAKVFANQADDDVLVVNADDPVASELADRAPARVLRCAVSGGADTWRVEDGGLTDPDGTVVVGLDELPRTRPHDVVNALVSAAAAREAGATVEGVADALRTFEGLPHRLTPVGEAGGVRFYDDSKATNPHAALTALEGFDSVVLIAGGRNKGLSLKPLAEAADRVRAVVAMGEAADEVEAVFSGLRPCAAVASMAEAVDQAVAFAEPGDAVLLSPACSSHDTYADYAARGDDFSACVRRRIDAGGEEHADG